MADKKNIIDYQRNLVYGKENTNIALGGKTVRKIETPAGYESVIIKPATTKQQPPDPSYYRPKTPGGGGYLATTYEQQHPQSTMANVTPSASSIKQHPQSTMANVTPSALNMRKPSSLSTARLSPLALQQLSYEKALQQRQRETGKTVSPGEAQQIRARYFPIAKREVKKVQKPQQPQKAEPFDFPRNPKINYKDKQAYLDLTRDIKPQKAPQKFKLPYQDFVFSRFDEKRQRIKERSTDKEWEYMTEQFRPLKVFDYAAEKTIQLGEKITGKPATEKYRERARKTIRNIYLGGFFAPAMSKGTYQESEYVYDYTNQVFKKKAQLVGGFEDAYVNEGTTGVTRKLLELQNQAINNNIDIRGVENLLIDLKSKGLIQNFIVDGKTGLFSVNVGTSATNPVLIEIVIPHTPNLQYAGLITGGVTSPIKTQSKYYGAGQYERTDFQAPSIKTPQKPRQKIIIPQNLVFDTSTISKPKEKYAAALNLAQIQKNINLQMNKLNQPIISIPKTALTQKQTEKYLPAFSFPGGSGTGFKMPKIDPLGFGIPPAIRLRKLPKGFDFEPFKERKKGRRRKGKYSATLGASAFNIFTELTPAQTKKLDKIEWTGFELRPLIHVKKKKK